MSHRLANKKNLGYGTLVALSVCLLSMLPTHAHNVKTAGDVAALFHIEPDHNPKAGQASRAWFTLTRKGGALISLEQCNCKLEVHQEPRKAGIKPLLEPPLKAISVEQYQSVPGAEIVFPKAGIYELQISGTARDGQSFQPFELSYTVTVQAGEAAKPSIAQVSTTTETAGSGNGWLVPGIAIASLLGFCTLWFSKRK